MTDQSAARQRLGDWMHDLCRELFPICRSITGDGVRATLDVVGREIPLSIHEVPSGTAVLDWTVPPEWSIRDAYVADADGRRLIDFRESNLHVVSYSIPVRARMTLDELRPHLHTLPDRPDWIPYRTSYYSEAWGFCLTQRALDALPDGEYEVVIDSELAPGSLSYGECLIPGAEDREILLTCHVCHPSLCNDNLSGISLLAATGKALLARELRYSWRLLFIPGTIGSITWLARNADVVDRIANGAVVSGVGDPGAFTWKRSRRGDTEIDRIAAHVLAESELPHHVVDFSPYGYDERQFCSPGFDLAVGRLGRAPHGEYPEYHTSADDLAFVNARRLEESYAVITRIVDVVERNRRYRNLEPYGEPQLGRRGLYRSVGGNVDSRSVEMGLLWVLNLSDGAHDLLEIAERSGLPFDAVASAADALVANDLLVALPEG